MNKSTIWWVIGIVVVVILGLWWWYASQNQQAPVAPTQTATTTTTGGEPITVQSRPSSSVASIVAGLSGVSNFQSLLAQSGVSLSGKGPYTVFVPLNTGFSYLPPGTISNMTVAQKKRFVEYSIVSGRALNISVADSGTIQALSKDMLNFVVNQNTGSAQVNSSFALQEYKGSNGVVYVITEPLLPPTAAPGQ